MTDLLMVIRYHLSLEFRTRYILFLNVPLIQQDSLPNMITNCIMFEENDVSSIKEDFLNTHQVLET